MSLLDYFIINEPNLFTNSTIAKDSDSKCTPQFMQDFASAYVTANFAYTLTELKYQGILDTSAPITLYNADKSSTQYLVTPLVDMPRALNGYILTEANPISDTVNVKVCFRGVQFTDISLIRAVEPGGPGIQSFMNASDSIMKQIEAITQQHTAVKLEFTGHSLGGADATNCLHDFLYHYVDQGQFQNVQSVTLNTLNAPGDYLNNKDSFSQLLFANKYNSAPLDVAINIAISDADFISQFGENAFSETPQNLATVQVLHVDKINTKEHSWGEFFRALPDIIQEMIKIGHALEPIFSPNQNAENELSPNFSYDYFNNQTETGPEKINEILTYKWHVTSAINFAANMLNNVIDFSIFSFQLSKGILTENLNDILCDLSPDFCPNTQAEFVYTPPALSILCPIEQPVASVFE